MDITEREKWDIRKITEDRDYYYSLPVHCRTAAVSIAAVSISAQNLEYVPETVLNRDICRAALEAKDADCSILPCIPFPDVQKEGIKRFSGNTPAFVLYSFVDIRDAKMAFDAVKADAYCLQLVPNELLTKDLCRTALQSPNSDEKVAKYVTEQFPELNPKQGTEQQRTGTKMKL